MALLGAFVGELFIRSSQQGNGQECVFMGHIYKRFLAFRRFVIF